MIIIIMRCKEPHQFYIPLWYLFTNKQITNNWHWIVSIVSYSHWNGHKQWNRCDNNANIFSANKFWGFVVIAFTTDAVHVHCGCIYMCVCVCVHCLSYSHLSISFSRSLVGITRNIGTLKIYFSEVVFRIFHEWANQFETNAHPRGHRIRINLRNRSLFQHFLIVYLKMFNNYFIVEINEQFSLIS